MDSRPRKRAYTDRLRRKQQRWQVKAVEQQFEQFWAIRKPYRRECAERNASRLESRQYARSYRCGHAALFDISGSRLEQSSRQSGFDECRQGRRFKSVRIPVAWKQYADSSGNINPTWMSRVTEVVAYARNAGLYVVINIHWDGGWMQPTYADQMGVMPE